MMVGDFYGRDLESFWRGMRVEMPLFFLRGEGGIEG